jgi:hypothetical protein
MALCSDVCFDALKIDKAIEWSKVPYKKDEAIQA